MNPSFLATLVDAGVAAAEVPSHARVRVCLCTLYFNIFLLQIFFGNVFGCRRLLGGTAIFDSLVTVLLEIWPWFSNR